MDSDLCARNGDDMLHDAGLVAACLLVGGALYLTIFFWVTVQRVNELGPPKPPPDQH